MYGYMVSKWEDGGGATKKSIEARIKSTQVVTYYGESRWSEQDFFGGWGVKFTVKRSKLNSQETKLKQKF